jgi:hypothetical protein
MSVFYFLWTPALDTGSGEHVPLGYIFASFMLAMMTGSYLFRRLVESGYGLWFERLGRLQLSQRSCLS